MFVQVSSRQFDMRVVLWMRNDIDKRLAMLKRKGYGDPFSIDDMTI